MPPCLSRSLARSFTRARAPARVWAREREQAHGRVRARARALERAGERAGVCECACNASVRARASARARARTREMRVQVRVRMRARSAHVRTRARRGGEGVKGECGSGELLWRHARYLACACMGTHAQSQEGKLSAQMSAGARNCVWRGPNMHTQDVSAGPGNLFGATRTTWRAPV